MDKSLKLQNSTESVFFNLFFKAMFLVGVCVLSLIVIAELISGNIRVFLFIPLIFLLLLLADAMVIPLEIKRTGLVYNHLWRKSYLPFSSTKVLAMPVLKRRNIFTKSESAPLIAVNRTPLRLYITLCDSKNGLRKTYIDNFGSGFLVP